MSLGTFVKKLVAELHRAEIDIPYENEALWHELFYKLKLERSTGSQPEFFQKIRFDWDGPFPKCKELSEFLHALHWTSNVSAHNPKFHRISLSEDIAKKWIKLLDTLDGQEKEFFDLAVVRAKEGFTSPQIDQEAA